jgi:hypothetical protein
VGGRKPHFLSCRNYPGNALQIIGNLNFIPFEQKTLHPIDDGHSDLQDQPATRFQK